MNMWCVYDFWDLFRKTNRANKLLPNCLKTHILAVLSWHVSYLAILKSPYSRNYVMRSHKERDAQGSPALLDPSCLSLPSINCWTQERASFQMAPASCLQAFLADARWGRDKLWLLSQVQTTDLWAVSMWLLLISHSVLRGYVLQLF